MPEDTYITIAVCTYSRASYLRRALETLIAQETGGFGYEVLVVDDESTDDTRAVVEAVAAGAGVPVRYVLQPGREGLAHVRNRAVAEMQGDWLVFFDDDQLAEPQLLKALLAVAHAQNARVVGGPRRLHLPPETLAELGPECRKLLGESIYDGPPAELSGKELPTTGNLLIAKAVFDEVGAFDPKFSGNEDTEFLHRVRRAGHVVWTAPDALCAHLIPAYRTERRYFRWTSLRWGHAFAKMDHKKHGMARVLAYCAARCAQAVLLNLPRWLLARVRGDRARALDLQLLLWRAQAYTRTTLWLLSPTVFPQKRYHHSLEFRREREMFPSQEPAM